MALLKWWRALLAGGGKARAAGTITRTCKVCGKTFTLPEEVQHWPDLCQECRAKHRPAETIRRKCRRCGREFAFASSEKRWPEYCPACREKR